MAHGCFLTHPFRAAIALPHDRSVYMIRKKTEVPLR